METEKEITLAKALIAYTTFAALLMLPAVTMVTLHYVPMSHTWHALGFAIALVLSSVYFCLFVELAIKDGAKQYEEGKKKGAEEVRAAFAKVQEKVEAAHAELNTENVVPFPSQSGPTDAS